MHIAVLDDNVADRNQMNRLLTRASDANRGTEIEEYYIDLFGSIESLMPKTAMYDAIFIDMVTEDIKGHEIAERIFNQGVSAKIVLCISKINYKDVVSAELKDEFLYINKPIKVPELNEILYICDAKRMKKEPKIELRTKGETIYIKYSDFYYAKALEMGKTIVTLTNGDNLVVLKDISAFRGDMSPYDFIKSINLDTIVSMKHVKKLSTLKVIMDDGTEFRNNSLLVKLLKKN